MLEKTKTKNTSEEYQKAAKAVGLLGLISLLKEYEEEEEYEECHEILKALKSIRQKYKKTLKEDLPIKPEEVKEEDLLRVGETLEEQKTAIKNQKERIKVWLAR